MKAASRTGLAPQALAVPRPPQAKGVLIAFGVAILGTRSITVDPAARAAVDRRQHHHRRRPSRSGRCSRCSSVSAAVNFVFAYIRRFVGRPVRARRAARPAHRDVRTAPTPRLRPPRPAPHRSARVACQLRPRARAAAAEFLPMLTGNVVLLVLSLVRDAAAVAAAHAASCCLTVPALLFVSLRLRKMMFPAQWDSLQRAGEVAGVVDEAVTGVRVVKGFGQEDRELDTLTDAAEGLYRSRVRNVRIQAQVLVAARRRSPRSARSACSRSAAGSRSRARSRSARSSPSPPTSSQLLAPVRMFASIIAVAAADRAPAPSGSSSILDSNPLVTEKPDAPDARRRPTARSSSTHVTYGYLRVGAGAARLLAAGRAGRDRRARRRVGLGQVDGQPAAPPLLRRAGRRDPHRRRRRARRHARLAAPRGRRRVRGRVPVLRLRAQQHRVRPSRRHRRRRRARRRRSRARTSSSRRSPTATTPSSASAGSRSPGGQRQRIAIARAVLTDPRVLVLDDATSSVDARTEEQIHATLREIMERPHHDPHRAPPFDAAPRRPHRGDGATAARSRTARTRS